MLLNQPPLTAPTIVVWSGELDRISQAQFQRPAPPLVEDKPVRRGERPTRMPVRTGLSERVRQALIEAEGSLTMAEIAQKCGTSKRNAHSAVSRWIRRQEVRRMLPVCQGRRPQKYRWLGRIA